MKATGEDLFAKPSPVTLGEILTAYIERRIKLESSNPIRTTRDVEGQRRRNLKHLVDRKIVSIRKPELLALREQVHKKRGPCAANRLMNMLRAAINFAIETELWKGENPAIGIPTFKEHPRRRFLYKDELDRLRAALDRTENRDLRDFVRLALMTAARKSDITSMKFSDLALDGGTWLVRMPKNAVPYRIALTSASKFFAAALSIPRGCGFSLRKAPAGTSWISKGVGTGF
jgi:integrase